MKSEKVRAVVLRRTNYGEADKIINIITPVGRRSLIARGVRRQGSKLSGGTELFSINELVIIKSKGDLDILRSARTVQYYSHIIEDYDRMQFAYAAIKLVSKASESLDEPEWYDILVETLAGLDAKTVSLDLTQTWFYLRYAEVLGHGLNLNTDTDGNKLTSEQSYRYDVGEQGFRLVESGEIIGDHIKLLRLIASKSIKTLAQIGGIEKVIADCLQVARQHSSTH